MAQAVAKYRIWRASWDYLRAKNRVRWRFCSGIFFGSVVVVGLTLKKIMRSSGVTGPPYA